MNDLDQRKIHVLYLSLWLNFIKKVNNKQVDRYFRIKMTQLFIHLDLQCMFLYVKYMLEFPAYWFYVQKSGIENTTNCISYFGCHHPQHHDDDDQRNGTLIQCEKDFQMAYLWGDNDYPPKTEFYAMCKPNQIASHNICDRHQFVDTYLIQSKFKFTIPFKQTHKQCSIQCEIHSNHLSHTPIETVIVISIGLCMHKYIKEP